MSNSYFKFKQFSVQQEKAAMKVCTDACLFGAWIAKELENAKDKAESILDIGAGTGLLSLMLAQKSKAAIEAVEIDDDAAQQAKENFEASPWREKLQLHKGKIQLFSQRTTTQFDVIVSNPPFFQGSLKSNVHEKNLAKHSTSLSFTELAEIAAALLKEAGKFYVLLPFAEFPLFSAEAIKQNLFLEHKVNLKQTPRHPFFRSMGVFSKQKAEQFTEDEMTIKQFDNEYSSGFVDLLKDYYLYL